LDVIQWAIRAVELGVGEIVVNSIDADGTKSGYDLDLLRSISERVNVPVVVSGGADQPEDLYKALVTGKADAVLAASIFHFGTYTIKETKEYLAGKGIAVRL
jgi:imidazole glycerol-phosphate synthase subunit HisF